jgi:hypothetical protein
LGDRGGNFTDFTPESARIPRNSGGEQWIPIMNKVAFYGQEAFDAVADVPCDLAHPETIGHGCNPGHLDPAHRQLQHDVALQSTPRPNLDREEISSDDQFPVPAEELLRGGFPDSMRRRLDAVLL